MSLRRIRQRQLRRFLARAGSVQNLRGYDAGTRIARGEKSGRFAFFDGEYDHSAVRTRLDFRAVLQVGRNWVYGFFAHGSFPFVWLDQNWVWFIFPKNRWSCGRNELDPFLFGTIQTCETWCAQFPAAENVAVPMGTARRQSDSLAS